jgi:hypothetical protein
MLIVKVKKFGVDWYIPYEMAADSAKGGFVRTPPPSINRVKMLSSVSGTCYRKVALSSPRSKLKITQEFSCNK